MNDLDTKIRSVVSDLPVPAGDPGVAIRRGRTLRRRRRNGTAVLAAAAVLTTVVAGSVALLGGDRDSTGGPAAQTNYPSLGELDLSEGLRAYASPDEEIHLGGRTFPIKDMGALDTEGIATSRGVVFFDKGARARLLDASGEVVALGPVPDDSDLDGWRPSSAADAQQPRVAITQPASQGVLVLLIDLDTRRVVAMREVPCDGEACEKVRVEGLDDGSAFVRTAEGIRLWEGERWELVSGPKTRIADVRGGTVLYDVGSPPPFPPSPWRAVPGPIDATLSHDGRNILDWSSRLEPSFPGGDPVVLEKGPTPEREGLAWWAFDTDGSVLVAVQVKESTPSTPPEHIVYDCVVPTGKCEELSTLTTASGDPMFIGADM